jgi:hypothetical protein
MNETVVGWQLGPPVPVNSAMAVWFIILGAQQIRTATALRWTRIGRVVLQSNPAEVLNAVGRTLLRRVCFWLRFSENLQQLLATPLRAFSRQGRSVSTLHPQNRVSERLGASEGLLVQLAWST